MFSISFQNLSEMKTRLNLCCSSNGLQIFEDLIYALHHWYYNRWDSYRDRMRAPTEWFECLNIFIILLFWKKDIFVILFIFVMILKLSSLKGWLNLAIFYVSFFACGYFYCSEMNDKRTDFYMNRCISLCWFYELCIPSSSIYWINAENFKHCNKYI